MRHLHNVSLVPVVCHLMPFAIKRLWIIITIIRIISSYPHHMINRRGPAEEAPSGGLLPPAGAGGRRQRVSKARANLALATHQHPDTFTHQLIRAPNTHTETAKWILVFALGLIP